MKYAYILSGLIATVSAHGVITSIQGANKVVMPGLSMIDGTPRDCTSPACGSEEDTSIIREFEMGTSDSSALGRNQAGPIDADKAIRVFMGTGGGGDKNNKRQVPNIPGLEALQNGGPLLANNTADGTETAAGTVEKGVSKAAGTGARTGMPTVGTDGIITLTYHQVNADGAGPLTAAVDATSGGTDTAAFKDAKVIQDVPGSGIDGLSASTTTDFVVKVQMPAGMTCSGTAGGVKNVCIVRVQNSSFAGPFGGSAAFVQSSKARKRAIEYNLRRRRV